MKYFDITLPVKGDRAKIVLVSCIHIGHHTHARERWLEWMNDEIIKPPDTWAIMLGDTIDNGTKQSPGSSIWENTKNPKQQCLEAFEILQPIIPFALWMQESNHSIRTYKETGFFTAEEWLADKFGIRWGSASTLATLRVKRRNKEMPYVVHTMHGEGGGTALSSALTAVGKQNQIAEADGYFRGHHHRAIGAKGMRFQPPKSGPVPSGRQIGYAATGCFLGYHDENTGEPSYAELKGYPPNCYGCTTVELLLDKKRMRIIV